MEKNQQLGASSQNSKLEAAAPNTYTAIYDLTWSKLT
jgi:hypothetical protein